jgi:hypothetical protein
MYELASPTQISFERFLYSLVRDHAWEGATAFGMSPEWVTALATVSTLVVIAGTAVAVSVQLRHIRAANQLMGLLRFTAIFQSRPFQDAITFVETGLPRKLDCPEFVQGLLQNPDRRAHKEFVVCEFLEQQGSHVKIGIIEEAQY